MNYEKLESKNFNRSFLIVFVESHLSATINYLFEFIFNYDAMYFQA